MPTDALCRLDDIEDGHSTGVTATIDGERTGVILVRQGNDVYAYTNVCPHIGAPLDFTPGQFLNTERDLIQCAMHGALFRIEDGQCAHGPCQGKGLTPVAVHVVDDNIYLA
ncbi:MAG: Rieske (2Fe-2S) protein [Arenibacter algicola]|nr:Rieske (2Fe-2S) protein [Arenibacter algicola]